MKRLESLYFHLLELFKYGTRLQVNIVQHRFEALVDFAEGLVHSEGL